MIYIVTVHHKTNMWIELQQKCLQKYTNEEYKIYGCNFQVGEYNKNYFFYENDLPGIGHHPRVSFLTDRILENKNIDDDDLILFLDGDAFPIANWVDFVKEKLIDNFLVGVERLENEEMYPHVSFICTYIKNWKEIMTWGDAWQHKGSGGPNDYGSMLGDRLRNKNIKWHKLHRSNKTNYHPLFFGIYDNLVYHHGCGFRAPKTFIDRKKVSNKISLDNIIDKNKVDSEIVYSKLVEDYESLIGNLSNE